MHDGRHQSHRGKIDKTFAHRILDFCEYVPYCLACVLVRNLLPWRLELRSCGTLETSFAWWVFSFLDHHISMETTCLAFTTLSNPSWHWKEEPVHLLPCCLQGCSNGGDLDVPWWTENNFSDFMAKVSYGQKQHHLVDSVLLLAIHYDHPNKKSRLTTNTAE